MNCQRSKELLSDHFERSLAPPLENEIRVHLEGCMTCRDFLAAMREGVELLKGLRVPEPPEELTIRILEHTRPALEAARLRSARAVAPIPSSLPFGYGWVAAAAVLALILLWRPAEMVSSFGRRTSQTAHQTYSFGLRTYNGAERWLEELDVLRLTVAVAFEDRINLLNERLRVLQKAGSKSDDDSSESRNVVAPEQSRV